jgi:SPP1 family predicted phage head-tail adaptor
MLTSSLNRQITVEKSVSSTSRVGTPKLTYSFLKNTFAEVNQNSGDSNYTQSGQLPFNKTEFYLRYDVDINYKCRILYDNEYYKIEHIQKIGRNLWMKISTINWEK